MRAALLALLLAAAVARADDPPGTFKSALPKDELAQRIRLEAHFRAGTTRSVMKYGHEATATKFSTGEDAHVPDTWDAFGWRVVIDVAVHRWVSLGFHGTRIVAESSRRSVHYRGIDLDDVYFGPGSKLRTTVDQMVFGGTCRFVVRDDETLRFSIGIGAAWASERLVLRRGDLQASGDVATFWVPTVSSWFSVRLAPIVSVFAESWTGLIAPARFPSLLSDFLVGFRWHIGRHIELITAFGCTSARIEDTKDLWGGKFDPDDKRERVEWIAETLDVGLAVSF